MFLQRSILLFMIFLCCFRSCLCTNCAYFPYHPSCRGTMKRTFNPVEFSDSYSQSRRMYGDSQNGCSFSDCKAKIKYLFTLLNDNADRQSQIANRKDNLYDDYEVSVRKGLRSEQRPRNNLFGMRNMNQDYID